ncbi:aromatic ring hydroxylase, partial [Micromonospora aurantiaca]|nr:aromatic ring hydroxylase [Micromonospora aurantiaca]
LNPSDPDLCGNLIEMGPSWGKGCEEWVLHFPPGSSVRPDEDEVVPKIREVLGLPDLDLTVHHVTKWTV